MKPTHFDGHDINDGSDYEAQFPQGVARSTVRFSPQLVDRLAGAPQYVRQVWESNPLTIVVFIIGGDVQTLLDQLKQWFDPSQGERVLRAQMNDGTDVYLDASVESLRIESRLQRPLSVTVRLLASDPRWLAYTETQTAWSVTSDGDTQAVSNAGNTYAYPTLEIVPNTVKDMDDSWLYRQRVVLVNRSAKRWSRWPWDVASNPAGSASVGWDTASLIKTATSTTLNGAFNAGASTCNLTDASAFPTNGMAYITDAVNGDEQIRWTGKSGNQLTGVTRGIGGTSDVNHTGGQTVQVSKMLADGADLRVVVDGRVVDHWFGSGSYAVNGANTTVWVNLDMAPALDLELDEAVDDGSATHPDGSDVLVKSTAGLPDRGWVLVGSEVVQYRDLDATHLKDVDRGAWGTTAAAHSRGDTIWWIEHEIQILYGYSGASTLVTDDDYKPMIDFSGSHGGTNAVPPQMQWTSFREEDTPRTAAWRLKKIRSACFEIARTATYQTDADPATKMCTQHWASALVGHPLRDTWYLRCPIGVDGSGAVAYDWWLYNPSSTVSFYLYVDVVDEDGFLTNLVTHTQAAGGNGSGSGSQDPDAPIYELRFRALLSDAVTRTDTGSEVDNVVLKYDGSTPYHRRMAEESAYVVDTTITNNTTSESMDLWAVMALNEKLVLDCEEMTAVHDDYDLDVPGIVTPDVARNYYLRLAPGSNTLQWDETAVAGVTVTVKHRGTWL